MGVAGSELAIAANDIERFALTTSHVVGVNQVVNLDQGVGWHKHNGKEVLRFHTNAYYRDLKLGVDNLMVEVANDPAAAARCMDGWNRLQGRTLTP